MTDDNTHVKKITPCDFKSDGYKVWEVTIRETLKLHKLLGIVKNNKIIINNNNSNYPRGYCYPYELRHLCLYSI